MTKQWTYENHELCNGLTSIVYDEHGTAIADYLDEPRARLIAAAPELLAVADAPRIMKVGKTLYLGFQDECGGWSVAIPEEMIGFVERWDAKRTAALAKAEGGDK